MQEEITGMREKWKHEMDRQGRMEKENTLGTGRCENMDSLCTNK